MKTFPKFDELQERALHRDISEVGNLLRAEADRGSMKLTLYDEKYIAAVFKNDERLVEMILRNWLRFHMRAMTEKLKQRLNFLKVSQRI